MVIFLNFMIAEAKGPRLLHSQTLDESEIPFHGKISIGDIYEVSDGSEEANYMTWNIEVRGEEKHFDLLQVPYSERWIH